MHFLRNALVVLLPGALLVLLLVSTPQKSALPGALLATHGYLPYMIILPSLLLCYAFRLTREFNLLVILLGVHWGLSHFIWQNPYSVNINKTFLLYAMAILLPANIIAHNLLKERGVISRHGLLRLLATLLQLLLVMLILWLGNKHMHRPLAVVPFPALHIKALAMPQLAVLAFLGAGLVTIIKAGLKPGTLNLNQPVFIIASLMAMQYAGKPVYGSLFLSMAALSILIAIILNSYNLAYLDELTGLPSRRALRQELSSLGKRYSVAMLDIDHFKKLNDTYGHDVGDQVLKMVAARIRRVAGAGKAFRYGGEEFTVLFPNKTVDEALVTAKQICAAIAKSPFVLRNKRRPKKKPPFMTKRRVQKKIDVTISIGVAQKTGQHKTAQDTIKAADKALYRAKDGGRNRACT